ncbi:hypothetical protein EC396_10790 [Lutibacter sp. HS1-25]|uniref:HU family DNA-binding protein n=1 Tax=Lutibacter sp. HS1-25 TaxID=2485000 RepID=UPI00101096FD|nr:HU family DNA-binding protein [Lutibacter sp. HS1-25]RXP52922.1 hypothetical protein EC396_10790 [Lutibacter sp. HS1-25]
MAIKYKVSKNVNTLKSSNEDNYYAKAISNGEVSSDELIDILSEKTKIHKADCVRFMMYLEETMVEQLENGKIVRLGDIGYFQVGISSNGVDAETKVTAKTINAAKINFRVGKSFRNMLKGLIYEKVKE